VTRKGTEEVRLQVQVPPGKPLGFDTGPSGDLLAVAGEQKFPLPEGNYWWCDAALPVPLYQSIPGTVQETVISVGDRMGFLFVLMYPAAFVGWFLAGGAGSSYPPK
jgi:hypothetical protein